MISGIGPDEDQVSSGSAAVRAAARGQLPVWAPNASSVRVLPRASDAGRVYTTTVQVRRNGVKGLLDGRMLVNHPTDFRDLNTDHWRRMPNDRVLGVACDDPTTFHRIPIVEVTGNGKAIR